MQRGVAPGTAISAAHSSGTAPKPTLAGGGGREHRDHVGGGREQDADDVVLDQAVARHQLAQELDRPAR